MGTDDFKVKDSGERAMFASGMVRDTSANKIDYALIFNGPMAERWAAHLTKGAAKYPDPIVGHPNWMLAEGLPEFFRAVKSAARHFFQWLMWNRDEDHAAAVFFNINLAEYVWTRLTEDARGDILHIRRGLHADEFKRMKGETTDEQAH